MQQVFDVYFSRLTGLGRKLLNSGQRRVADEEDLAVQVLASFLTEAAAGELPPLHSRHDVWRLLSKRLRQRSSNQRRDQSRQKRGADRVLGESVFRSPDGLWNTSGINQLPDNKLESLAQLHADLVDCLNDETLRQLALLLLQGFTIDEISEKLKKSRATIYRKMSLIKDAWANS